MTARRAAFWLSAILVVLCFGVPMFKDLGTTDLTGDEPIYAFAVDRILDQGNWLTPKSIPDDRAAFLEKPPLKFWIVAGSMRAGLLPHDEFGYRFWDVIFGTAAFLFVLAIGHRMSGVVCGLTADLVLFVHAPLILEHGFRSNNMEAGLVLVFTAGVFHALVWSEATKRWQHWFHPLAAAFWFAFGFMLKFVAALFLPAIVAGMVVCSRRWRRRALADWKPWLASAAFAALLILPWFVYQFEHQPDFWSIIFGEHIFVRFTSYLDPSHLHPWYYYLAGMGQQFSLGGTLTIVVAGLVILVYQAVRYRSDAAILLLLWAVPPIAAISIGTSKLYHYVYPFLPPIALGAGLVPAAVMDAARQYSDAMGRGLERTGLHRIGARLSPRVRLFLIVVAVAAIAIAAITPLAGGISLRAGGIMLFRNSATTRPLVLATIILMLLGLFRLVPEALLFVALLLAIPFDGYRSVKAVEVGRATWEGAPMRTIRDCLLRLQASGSPRGVYMHTADEGQWRYAYYLRDAGWNMEEMSDDQKLMARLFDREMERPVLLQQSDYTRFRDSLISSGQPAEAVRLDAIPRVTFDDDRLLLLPREYGACSAVTGAAVRRHS